MVHVEERSVWSARSSRWRRVTSRSSQGWLQKIANVRHDNRFSLSDRGRFRGNNEHSPCCVRDSPDSVAETPLDGNRFAVLGEVPEAEVEDRPRRRLVSCPNTETTDKLSTMSDTVGGVSDVEVTQVVEPTVEEVPVPMDVRVRAPVSIHQSGCNQPH